MLCASFISYKISSSLGDLDPKPPASRFAQRSTLARMSRSTSAPRFCRGRRSVGRLSHLKWGVLSSPMPNGFGPGIRRSIVDQTFLYAALPPTLIPFIDLMPPVGGQHLFRCPLQIIGPV